MGQSYMGHDDGPGFLLVDTISSLKKVLLLKLKNTEPDPKQITNEYTTVDTDVDMIHALSSVCCYNSLLIQEENQRRNTF